MSAITIPTKFTLPERGEGLINRGWIDETEKNDGRYGSPKIRALTTNQPRRTFQYTYISESKADALEFETWIRDTANGYCNDFNWTDWFTGTIYEVMFRPSVELPIGRPTSAQEHWRFTVSVEQISAAS